MKGPAMPEGQGPLCAAVGGGAGGRSVAGGGLEEAQGLRAGRAAGGLKGRLKHSPPAGRAGREKGEGGKQQGQGWLSGAEAAAGDVLGQDQQDQLPPPRTPLSPVTACLNVQGQQQGGSGGPASVR